MDKDRVEVARWRLVRFASTEYVIAPLVGLTRK